MKHLRLGMSPRQRLRRALVFASFLLFPVTLNYFSPVLIVQGAISGVVTASALTFGALFLSGLFFGRGFCAWACPGAGLQEPLMGVNPNPLQSDTPDKIKWFIWVPWVAVILTCYGLTGLALRFAPLYRMPAGISVWQPMMFIPYFTVLALIIWLALALGRRGFCHAACWMAPFLILGAKAGDALGLRRLRLVSRPERCDGCGTCSSRCLMSLAVRDMAASGRTDHAECVLCGECADACPNGALKLGFIRPGTEK
ncbi:4Fe-4S binding protein [Fundidesulfovibrio soli]|uniref:4Fe-4S binding protein n=1 Tax=Fundidesulfovibrio soli TaxID=2922716 RepID=UPI001FB03DFF|nr:4Fe-4S binding protein [Fundidesulfovibrio soli]